ncbi:MAG: hypothetical protein H6740_26775 [Alphaproteobacteria bacterium]|nr:hypothetical protein [Alphaproteobacteria bacterium]
MTRWTLALCLTFAACKDGSSVDSGDEPAPVDADGDGFTEDEDCDDGDAAVNPDAAEVCDGVDNNCDHRVDDDDPAVDLSTGGTWYYDLDLDGHGDDDGEVMACEAPANALPTAGDCDSSNARIHDDAEEVCDGLDNDCDGAVDDADEDFGGEVLTWYVDADGDGYGDASQPGEACAVPSGGADNGDDCDDDDSAVHPRAVEVCNDVDDDCDGEVDDPSRLLGSDAACPALDCADAAATLSAASDGLYWIDPEATGAAYEAYCDMGTDGGGWTLVMRCVDDHVNYDDAIWESTDLLDGSNYDFTTQGCSKYEAYNSVGFTELRTSSTTDWSDDFVEDLGTPYDSTLALFSGDGFELSTELQDYFNDISDPLTQSWGCTTYVSYGINQADYLDTAFLNGGGLCDWNGWSRWGQRVNANHLDTGNHSGQGWGAYSTIAGDNPESHTDSIWWSIYNITQLMWVR